MEQVVRKPFIFLKDKKFPVKPKKNKYSKFKKNVGYIFEDKIFVYKGRYVGREKNGYFYKNEDGQLVFSKTSVTESDIFYVKEKKSPDSVLKNIINSCKRINNDKEFKEVINEQKKGHVRRGKLSNKPLRFEIFKDDSKVVKHLKEIINDNNVFHEDVYEKIGNKSSGYNLIYGLRTRTAISFENVERWADILNMDIDVQLVSKSKFK
jgi:hypothetical protein